MFYGKESIEEQFNIIKDKMSQQELFIFVPMPSYKEGDRWTDEFRIRDGYTKLADGSWVTIHKMTTYIDTVHKNTIDLYEQYQKLLGDLDSARRQKSEMEFGLRHAQKSLNKAMTMKGNTDE
jgi:hypothetical protein